MADTAPLSTRLRKASRKIHTVSDSLVNIKLIALLTDRELYARALSRFYYVFTALERALDEALEKGHADVHIFKTFFHDGAMYRSSAFREDLKYLLGPNWENCCGPKSAPLQEYEHHLRVLASSQPLLLLAHSFTQYLAITSGGQAVRCIIRKHLALPEGAGTASFEFKVESSNALKSKLKATMDEWGRGLSEEQVQQLVTEHLAVFRYNNAIIRAFPIAMSAVVKGVLRVVPRNLLIVALVLLMALIASWVSTGFRP